MTVAVHPARDGGIRFVRESAPMVTIPAHLSAVRSTARRTVLAADGYSVATTEHLLAALYALGVDHARVVVDGEELPALDGSAGEYVEAIRSVGLTTLPQPRKPLVLRQPVWWREGDAHLLALPSTGLRISYVLEYAHPLVGTQVASFAVTPETFGEAIAPARTFGFLEWAEALRARGLALGASPENTVVIAPDRILAPLRFADEFVRHKVLDLIGDLALLGRPLRAHVIAIRGGHATNVALAKRIAAETGLEALSVRTEAPCR